MTKTKFHIDFMGKRRFAIIGSGILIVIAFVALFARGLDLGIDFTGGTLVEVGYQQSADLTGVRAALEQGGFSGATVQHFGTSRDVLIRMAPDAATSHADLSTRILAVLREGGHEVDVRRVEYVGPQIGDELAEQGGMAMLIALIAILIYVSLRFEYRLAIGSVAALLHDVILVLGFFAITQIEFDLSVLAAILAVIGYSLNDTIVVFDRIRENFRKIRKGSPVEVVNTSINQTLARTLVTSMTTLLVLLALFLIGGEVIHAFSIALIVGVVVGTYSSIYIASSTSLALGVSKQDLMKVEVEKEGADLGRP